MSVSVGSFVKVAGTVAVSQPVTGVGAAPKALFLWTAGATANETWRDGYTWSVGLTTGTAESGAIALSAEDNVGTTNVGQAIQQKALTLVSYAGAVSAECDLTSFNTDGFTVNWTTNDTTAAIIHYLALYGDDLTNAKVMPWAMGTATGNQEITGVGFQPDCLIHVYGSGTAYGASAATSTTSRGLGMMTGTASQYAVSMRSKDAEASGYADVYQDSSYGIYMQSGAVINGQAAYVSAGTDSFTVNIVDAPDAAFKVFTLCLKGGSYALGSYDVAAAGTVTVTGLGSKPQGLLLLPEVTGNTGSYPRNNTNGANLAISATDGVNEESAGIRDDDGADPTDTGGYSSSGKIALMVDPSAAAHLDNAADILSMDAAGFKVNYTTYNTANRVWYLAFRLEPDKPDAPALTATAISTDAIRVDWLAIGSADGYVIDYQKDAAGTAWLQVVDTGSGLTLTTTKTGLTPGTKYNFRGRTYTT